MASAIIGGVVGEFLNLNPNITDSYFESIKQLLSEDEDGSYSFQVGDCYNSTGCMAVSMSCQGLEHLVFPDVTTTATPADDQTSAVLSVSVPFGPFLFLVFALNICTDY